jgi:hypothetical protein
MTLTPSINAVTPNPESLITRAIADSAQIPPSVSKDGVIDGAGFGYSTTRGPLLPPFGTRQREYALREMYRRDEMGLITGSFTGITKTVASLGWEIKGDDTTDPLFNDMAASQGWRLRRSNGVEYFQEVLRQANFGAGWGTLITQWMNDYLRYDAGGYVEVIAAGDAYDKPMSAITGIAHLDPLRTYPTGDPRYPAVYYDRYGGLHVFHHSRVLRMVDMDDGDEMHPGYGKSALSRAVAIAMQEMWISRYITARLDDKPSPGLTVIGGIMKAEWEATDRQFLTQQRTDAGSPWGNRKFYFTPDPAIMPKVENVEFQVAPENFDYRVYTDINVDRLANAIGVDRQELMQLMGGNIGSGAQSVVLEQKSRGKCIGYFLQETERKINGLLPDGYTFEFKQRNSAQSREDALEAKLWTGVAAEAGAALSANEKRALLADQVEAIRDAIENAPRADDVSNQPMTAADDAPGATPIAPTQTPVPQDPVAPAQPVQQKDYATTQAMFVQDVGDLLMSAVTPNPYLDKRAFGVTLRSLLKNYGLQAYKDGMAQGGVIVDTLDPDDTSDATRVFIGQSVYVNGLADDVFVTKAVTPENARSRAQLWGKSLQQFNDAGLYSADRNGMYRWDYGFTEHCKDCLRLNGQVHRLKTWKARELMPRSSKLFCRGFNCACRMTRTTEKARGRF